MCLFTVNSRHDIAGCRYQRNGISLYSCHTICNRSVFDRDNNNKHMCSILTKQSACRHK